jgi:Tol biopolymer transport system component
MLENDKSPNRTGQDSPAGDRLESWKEIAVYLKRDVRTVQRWEKRENLPVYRHIHSKLGTVYAYKGELDAWWRNGHERLESLKLETLPNDQTRIQDKSLNQVESPEGREECHVATPSASGEAIWTRQVGQPVTQEIPVQVNGDIRVLWIAIVPILLVAGSLIVRSYFKPRERFNLQNMTVTRLTDTGNVYAAAISPDGRYVAYTKGDEKIGLWVRQVATGSTVEVVPPSSEFYGWIGFSPDSNYIYFQRTRGAGESDGYVIPALGGTAKLVAHNIYSGLGISPDGAHSAFFSSTSPSDTLTVANGDDTDEREIKAGKDLHIYSYPLYTSPSWSPDGRMVAVPAALKSSSTIALFPVSGGEPTLIPFAHMVVGAVWLRDQTGLFVTASALAGAPGYSGIWYQPFPKGAPQRITNDSNAYASVSATTDARFLAAVQRNYPFTPFVGAASDPDGLKPIGSTRSEGINLAWMPDGRILENDRGNHFLALTADGKSRDSLFFQEDASPTNFNLSVCGTGRFIVFARLFQGIWRVDSSGRNLQQLTQGASDYSPDCSPDGTSVIYGDGSSRLMRVPIEGGTPVTLCENCLQWPRYSPDGGQIAGWVSGDNGNTMLLGVISSQGGKVTKTFAVAAGRFATRVVWKPDGTGIAYVVARGLTANIWNQPISGSPPQQVTHFPDRVIAFAWSQDGKQLALTRLKESSDVVLFRFR